MDGTCIMLSTLLHDGLTLNKPGPAPTPCPIEKPPRRLSWFVGFQMSANLLSVQIFKVIPNIPSYIHGSQSCLFPWAWIIFQASAHLHMLCSFAQNLLSLLRSFYSSLKDLVYMSASLRKWSRFSLTELTFSTMTITLPALCKAVQYCAVIIYRTDLFPQRASEQPE